MTYAAELDTVGPHPLVDTGRPLAVSNGSVAVRSFPPCIILDWPDSVTMKFVQLWLTGSLLAMFVGTAAAADPGPKVDYIRDVRPILAKNCFRCHGPDEQKREAGLRLDSLEGATHPGEKGHPAIKPNDPDASEAIKRLTATDEDERMPPVETKQTLTKEQIATLRRWVAEGAEYREHWSWIAPVKANPPTVKQRDWVHNPIDAFILAKLEQAGLAPNAPATKAALIRRVTLDLVGLPPSPAEVAEFVNDRSDKAYEKLVDRLLASPRYGERWARRWLDLARYADTNGYEKDRARSIWPYRDWVINALNADMPFTQFTLEQLAGDLLPNATIEQKIATGFHRNTMLNEEGGIDPLEFRWYATNDRTQTTGTVWLGLTLQCCQCHTHKYDPLPQSEYYQLMAYLNNADEPDLDIPNADAEKRQQQNLAEAKKLLAALPDHWPLEKSSDDQRPAAERRKELVEQKFNDWLTAQRQATVPWQALKPATAKANSPLLTVQPDHSVFASGDITKDDRYELTFTDMPAGITAIRLETLPDERLPAHGPGMTYYEGPKGDFFLGEFQVTADEQAVKFAKASESYSKNGFGSNPATAWLATDGDPQTGWSCDGRPGEAHEAVFVLPQPLTAKQLQVKMQFGRHYACSLGRFRISVTTADKPAVARDLPDDLQRLVVKPADQLAPAERQQLLEHFLLTAAELKQPAAKIKNLRKPVSLTTTMVLHERSAKNRRPTYVHKRGEYLQPAEMVTPATFTSLHPLDRRLPGNRLGLAQWLIARENPLMARVTVNRQWQAFFGRGIVRTTEDFGVQGEPPTHPELLDWLAVEFMDQGWSLKKLHKLMVMSATYQQAGQVESAAASKDPENKLLSRFPHSRLEGEIIRDAALSVSGLLSLKMGGPGVRPPQPEGVTEVAYGHPKWETSPGEDRYRRSVYTFIKRTAPFALYSTFDAPSGESCLARRDMSNTPLQALTVLNDVTFIDAAQALGKSLAAEPGDTAVVIQQAFARTLARAPTPAELTAVTKFYERQRARLDAHELEASALAGPNVPNAAVVAAWTTVARALLNTDEFVTKP